MIGMGDRAAGRIEAGSSHRLDGGVRVCVHGRRWDREPSSRFSLDLWVSIFTNDVSVTRPPAGKYLATAAPMYAFIGLASSMYFSSQGAAKGGSVRWLAQTARLLFVGHRRLVACRRNDATAQKLFSRWAAASMVVLGTLSCTSVIPDAMGTEARPPCPKSFAPALFPDSISVILRCSPFFGRASKDESATDGPPHPSRARQGRRHLRMTGINLTARFENYRPPMTAGRDGRRRNWAHPHQLRDHAHHLRRRHRRRACP